MAYKTYDSLEDIISLQDLPSGECTFCCPFCPPEKHDGKRKLSVNFDKNLYHCWRCGSSGKAVDLLRQYSNISNKELNDYQFKDFIFTKQIHSTMPETEVNDINTELFIYDSIGVSLIDNVLPTAMKYLTDRGITREEIEYYDIRMGRQAYHNRILIPTYDEVGNVTYIVARDYSGLAPNKYFNSPGSNKSEHVWNLNHVKPDDTIIITEGCFSGISANRVPDMTAVCTFGKAMSDFQAKLIADKKPKEIIMSLDGDVSEAETIKNIELIRNHYTGLITIAHLPADKDPNDMTLDEYMEVLRKRTTYSYNTQILKKLLLKY